MKLAAGADATLEHILSKPRSLGRRSADTSKGLLYHPAEHGLYRDQIRDTGNKVAVSDPGVDSQEFRNCECEQSPLEADGAESGVEIPLRVMAIFSRRFHAHGLSM